MTKFRRGGRVRRKPCISVPDGAVGLSLVVPNGTCEQKDPDQPVAARSLFSRKGSPGDSSTGDARTRLLVHRQSQGTRRSIPLRDHEREITVPRIHRHLEVDLIEPDQRRGESGKTDSDWFSVQ